MADKGTGNSPENIPQIDQVSAYTIPTEDLTVKYQKDQSTGALSKKERTCNRKTKQKGSSDDFKAENLDGHKNFDNIEDTLAFINGKKIENGNQLEKVSRKREKENSLGAIRKTYSFKDKYFSMNTSQDISDEKPEMSLKIGKVLEGSKNHDSVEQPTKTKEEQITLESIVINNEDDLETTSNSSFLPIKTTCVKLQKFYDQINNSNGLKKRNDEDLQVTEAVAKDEKKSFWEISRSLIDSYDNLTTVVENENRISLNDKLEMIHSHFDKITQNEKNIESELRPFISMNLSEYIPEKITQMLKVIGEAKTGLKLLEKETKLRLDVSQLTETLIEQNETQIELLTEQIDLQVEYEKYKSMKSNKVSVYHLAILEQKTKENESATKGTRNKVATCKKQIEELQQEKEAQNEVINETLEKVKEIEAKIESPINDCLAIEYKPSNPHMENDKPATVRNPCTPCSLPKESTYELTFHRTSLTTFKTSGKEVLSSILNNCELVLAATNWSILKWGINSPHPDAHKKLDEENLRRRCSKDNCKKCNHNMKGCGLDLLNCDRCELVTKSIAYHEEYNRIVKIVERGGSGKPIKRQAEGLAKDAMRSFQNVLIPFLVGYIKGECTHFLEERGSAKLQDVWERLLYIKFPLQRVRIDQDYLSVLKQKTDILKEANVEYEDVLDMVRSYVSSRKQLVELWDSNVLPNFSAAFLKTGKDLDSWTKCADDSEMIVNEVLSMIDAAEKASTSGEKVEVVDLKCVETFLCSALKFTYSAQETVSQKIPVGLMQKTQWAQELLTKIHCIQCRRVILVPGEELAHLEKCSVCKAVRYCNATCQEVHWDDHKDKCLHMKKVEKTKKRKESRAGEKAIRKKEKFWEKVLKPLLCRPGVTIETLENSLF